MIDLGPEGGRAAGAGGGDTGEIARCAHSYGRYLSQVLKERSLAGR